MSTDPSLPLKAKLESLPQEVQFRILEFFGAREGFRAKYFAKVRSLNRYFCQLVLLYMNRYGMSPEGKTSCAKMRCTLVCNHLQDVYKNIILQTLLLLGERPYSLAYKEELIDTIALYAQRGRNNNKKANWRFPFDSHSSPEKKQPENLLKRLSLYGNKDKQFDFLVDDMKKRLLSLNWRDFHGLWGKKDFAFWVLYMTSNEEIPFYQSNEEIRPPSSEGSMEAKFRLSFIENVVVPLAKSKVTIALPDKVLEKIFDFCSTTPRESSFNIQKYWDIHCDQTDYWTHVYVWNWQINRATLQSSGRQKFPNYLPSKLVPIDLLDRINHRDGRRKVRVGFDFLATRKECPLNLEFY